MPTAAPSSSTTTSSEITNSSSSSQPLKLQIVEWHHMNLYKFYPMALAASWMVRGTVYPLNLIKARLQLQKQNRVYKNPFHAFSTICRQEGPLGLYRGFWITLPQILGGFVYSTIYEKSRSELRQNMQMESAQIVSSLAGGVASIFTQFVFVPTDVISQYLMIYNNPKHFSGGAKNAAVLDYLQNEQKQGGRTKLTLGFRVARAVYKIDGLRGFYRGFLPSALLYGTHASCFWSAYYTWLDLFKHLSVRSANSKKDAAGESATVSGNLRGLFPLQCLSGGFAGATAAFITNSLEVFRLRIQVHRTDYVETLSRLWREEGLRTFTKGLGPRMTMNVIHSMLIMTSYEAIKRLSVLPEYRHAIVW